jgi:hypothetical protein
VGITWYLLILAVVRRVQYLTDWVKNSSVFNIVYGRDKAPSFYLMGDPIGESVKFLICVDAVLIHVVNQQVPAAEASNGNTISSNDA